MGLMLVVVQLPLLPKTVSEELGLATPSAWLELLRPSGARVLVDTMVPAAALLSPGCQILLVLR